MKLNLDALDKLRLKRREVLRAEVRRELREALNHLLPSEDVIVFGSITEPYKFHDRSDVDIALYREPPSSSLYRLLAQLNERLARPVDLVILHETRLKDKIIQTGEVWTRSG
jgi:predicted nucleotidyltransferase